jgi:hypothetical protein
VEEELKPEPGHVTTLLQLMVVQIVLGIVLKVRIAMKILVQVIFKALFTLTIILKNLEIDIFP